MERQSLSRDNSNHTILDDLNVFDDNFAIDDFAIADGFAPRRRSAASSTRSVEEPPIRSIAAHMSQGPTIPQPASRGNRNSTRKSRRLEPVENPFQSVEDDDAESLHSIQSHDAQFTASHAPSLSHRSISSASSQAFARTHSPFQGDSGPSHPYNMYPQGTTFGRSPSTSTTSTIRPPPSVPLLTTRPAHPYSMYPQNVADDMEDEDEMNHPQNHIPVGFPGVAPIFVNRRLPRNDHDNMSISGHSEQLPPYSEYPEDGAPKNILLPQQLPTGQASEQQVPQVQDPFAQRAPQSMADSSAITAGQGSPLNTTPPTDAPPKTWSEKTWAEKRKTKFCGIPFGFILIAVGCVVLIVIIAGAVIRGFVNGHRKDGAWAARASAASAADVQAQQTGTSTNSLIDATPMSTSAAFPLPTGSFSLQLGGASQVQNACLMNSSQAAAWQCDMSEAPQMAIDISFGPDGGPEGAQLYSNSSSSFNYGMNPPDATFSSLQLVQDLDAPQMGPAYQFQAWYNKLIVLPSSAFSPSADNDNAKRDAQYNGHHHLHDWFLRRQVAAGEKPWFCYWNGTLMEGFIYIKQNAMPWNTTTGGQSQTTNMPSSTTPTPLSTLTGTTAAISTSSPTPSSTYKRLVRRADNDGDSDDYDAVAGMPLYPYVIKLEERRVSGSPQPYCQQYQMLDNGQPGLLTDPVTGLPIVVLLAESYPNWGAYASAGLTKRGSEVAGSCHCQWFSGSPGS